MLGKPGCEETDIVNPFWDVNLVHATTSKDTFSVRLPPTYRSLRAAHELFMEKALKRNMSDYN